MKRKLGTAGKVVTRKLGNVYSYCLFQHWWIQKEKVTNNFYLSLTGKLSKKMMMV
jgi:hypothetical protein